MEKIKLTTITISVLTAFSVNAFAMQQDDNNRLYNNDVYKKMNIFSQTTEEFESAAEYNEAVKKLKETIEELKKIFFGHKIPPQEQYTNFDSKINSKVKYLISPIEDGLKVNVQKLFFNEKNKIKTITFYKPIDSDKKIAYLKETNNLIPTIELTYDDDQHVIEKIIYDDDLNKEYKIEYDSKDYVNYSEASIYGKKISVTDEESGKIFINTSKTKDTPNWILSNFDNDIEYEKEDLKDESDENNSEHNENEDYYDKFYSNLVFNANNNNNDIYHYSEKDDNNENIDDVLSQKEAESKNKDIKSCYYKQIIIDDIDDDSIYIRKKILHEKDYKSESDKTYSETFYPINKSNISFEQFFKETINKPLIRFVYDKCGNIRKKIVFLSDCKIFFIIQYKENSNIKSLPKNEYDNDINVTKFDYENSDGWWLYSLNLNPLATYSKWCEERIK